LRQAGSAGAAGSTPTAGPLTPARPGHGAPAFTGVVQVTAIAPTVVEAEVLAKTALLRGADRAAGALRHGGVVVYDDASAEILEPA